MQFYPGFNWQELLLYGVKFQGAVDAGNGGCCDGGGVGQYGRRRRSIEYLGGCINVTSFKTIALSVDQRRGTTRLSIMLENSERDALVAGF